MNCDYVFAHTNHSQQNWTLHETEIRFQADTVLVPRNAKTFITIFTLRHALDTNILTKTIRTITIIGAFSTTGCNEPTVTRNVTPPTSRWQLKAHVYNASKRGWRGPTKSVSESKSGIPGVSERLKQGEFCRQVRTTIWSLAKHDRSTGKGNRCSGPVCVSQINIYLL